MKQEFTGIFTYFKDMVGVKTHKLQNGNSFQIENINAF